MGSPEILDRTRVLDASVASCGDGLEQHSNGVKGSDNLGDDLLEDLDSYLEDIDDRLTISRMNFDAHPRVFDESVATTTLFRPFNRAKFTPSLTANSSWNNTDDGAAAFVKAHGNSSIVPPVRPLLSVDLLGDEVDALLSLLEKIYIALDHYSPILQHYPGIIEILKLVRRELSGESTKPV
ncbi:hypothetical protein L1049_010096 [Liquidambar formosana]|uniref:Uncharacterized protein n=1 Tax=Liquidambar formosana TaxID=63359 RepID=A0AAP0N9M0_LIQFO